MARPLPPVKRKTPHDLAVFMYHILRGAKSSVTETLCDRMQRSNNPVFINLCKIVSSPDDSKICAHILTELGKEPLIEA